MSTHPSMGQPFIVENKPGAGNNMGTEAVVNAPADGYTMLLVNPGQRHQRRAAQEPELQPPEAFGQIIAAETAKWAGVVISSGAKVE